MLFYSANGLMVAGVMLAVGFVAAFIFDGVNLIKFLCCNGKVACVIFDFLGALACGLVFFLTNLKFNYGEIRLFSLMSFCFAFCLQRASVGKLLAKTYSSCYTLFEKAKTKIFAKLAERKKWRKKNKNQS